MPKRFQEATGMQWVLFSAFALAMCIALFRVATSIATNPSSETLVPGSSIDLRGDRFLLLRNVATKPYFGLGIHLDGTVSLFPYPQKPGNLSQLTETEWKEMTAFREQWCNNDILFPETTIHTPYYDLGVRCNNQSYQIRQGKIIATELPAVLNALLQRLHLPQGQ